MNILFFNHGDITSVPGSGIQRVTHNLSMQFIKEEGIKCYLAFYARSTEILNTVFTDKIQLNNGEEDVEPLSDFIVKHKIDFVIFQHVLVDEALGRVRRSVDKAKNCKIIYCIHTSPVSSLTKPSIQAEFFRLVRGITVKISIKRIITGLLPRFVYNFYAKRHTQKRFSQYNKYSDKIVLLSEHQINEYCEISGIPFEMRNKITAIPNPLTFDKDIPVEFDKKQNEVLVVSRLSERHKRITYILKIWREFQKKYEGYNYRLVLVGSGEDERYVKNTNNINILMREGKNVSFEGSQDPTEYYKRASIFMMTSNCEGFPMTLLEAQQTGVVPVVFDSFSAVRDVIEDHYNGLLVEHKNFTQFADSLAFLMQYPEERKRMAANAMQSCKKFSPENVVKKWINLFEELQRQ
ncbi:MAG: glycosyltransferase [Prevotellaceae bacterium]|jgi:glycosyltransferase involved in cell wall biosynthesis|nr:glycosyltransferase [Prevotellaceae bacterium]